MSLKKVLTDRIPRNSPVELSPDEAVHLTRVLRLGQGATVLAIDAMGSAIECVLRIQGKRTLIESKPGAQVLSDPPGAVVPLTLEMALLKGEAMDWAIEKAVELGVEAITPLLTAHTVVQMGRKGPDEFQERWQKLADQALKQCGRLTRMRVETPIPLQDLWTHSPNDPAIPRVFCDEIRRSDAQEFGVWVSEAVPKALRVLLGPEGGWSDNERELLTRTTPVVSLGPSVLRGETAAVYVAAVFGSLTRRPR